MSMSVRSHPIWQHGSLPFSNPGLEDPPKGLLVRTRKSRNAKKWLRDMKRSRFYGKLVWGLSLKPGDIIGTCTGYNEKIETITPVWGTVHRTGRVLLNFNVVTEQPVGGNYSLMACCNPAETKTGIMAYFKEYITKDPRADYFLRMLASGQILREDGTLTPMGISMWKDRHKNQGNIPLDTPHKDG